VLLRRSWSANCVRISFVVFDSTVLFFNAETESFAASLPTHPGSILRVLAALNSKQIGVTLFPSLARVAKLH